MCVTRFVEYGRIDCAIFLPFQTFRFFMIRTIGYNVGNQYVRIYSQIFSISLTSFLARTLNLTVYDALYLELAESPDCQVVMSDKPYFDQVSQAPDIYSKRNICLRDYIEEANRANQQPGSSSRGRKGI